MPHAFRGQVNPVCAHCGLNAHHLSEQVLTEPCPVADATPNEYVTDTLPVDPKDVLPANEFLRTEEANKSA